MSYMAVAVDYGDKSNFNIYLSLFTYIFTYVPNRTQIDFIPKPLFGLCRIFYKRVSLELNKKSITTKWNSFYLFDNNFQKFNDS